MSQSRFLRLRLPLLIALAMVSLVGVFLWVASREVQRALAIALDSGGDAASVQVAGRLSLVGLAFVGATALVVGAIKIGITRAQREEAGRALATQRQSEAHCRAVVEVAFDCIITTDGRGRVTEFNPAAEQAFGYRKADIVGRDPVDFIVPPRLRDAYRRAFADMVLAGDDMMPGRLMELPGQRADGTEVPLEVALSAFRSGGSLMFTAVLRNIAERNRLEQARLSLAATGEQDRLVIEANRLKGAFQAHISHELRSPLHAIIGFSELMHSGKTGALSPVQQAHLGDILTSAHHLMEIVTDVVDLAKVEAGKMTFHAEAFDLGALAGEVRDVLRGLASAKGLRLGLEVDPAAGVAHLDPRRVKQILYNYLSNAIKFTGEGGQVDVCVASEGADAFRISVRDTGIGISPDDLPRLFVEFQQMDTGSGRRQDGTGLGLALTKRIAEALGGHVGVHSAEGAGSTFWVVLPRALRAAPEPAQAA